jgi:hypothetical protein
LITVRSYEHSSLDHHCYCSRHCYDLPYSRYRCNYHQTISKTDYPLGRRHWQGRPSSSFDAKLRSACGINHRATSGIQLSTCFTACSNSWSLVSSRGSPTSGYRPVTSHFCTTRPSLQVVRELRRSPSTHELMQTVSIDPCLPRLACSRSSTRRAAVLRGYRRVCMSTSLHCLIKTRSTSSTLYTKISNFFIRVRHKVSRSTKQNVTETTSSYGTKHCEKQVYKPREPKEEAFRFGSSQGWVRQAFRQLGGCTPVSADIQCVVECYANSGKRRLSCKANLNYSGGSNESKGEHSTRELLYSFLANTVFVLGAACRTVTWVEAVGIRYFM